MVIVLVMNIGRESFRVLLRKSNPNSFITLLRSDKSQRGTIYLITENMKWKFFFYWRMNRKYNWEELVS